MRLTVGVSVFSRCSSEELTCSPNCISDSSCCGSSNSCAVSKGEHELFTFYYLTCERGRACKTQTRTQMCGFPMMHVKHEHEGNSWCAYSCNHLCVSATRGRAMQRFGGGGVKLCAMETLQRVVCCDIDGAHTLNLGFMGPAGWH